MKKKNINFLIALYISKIISILIRLLFKDRGTHLPGSIALRICEDFLGIIDTPKTIIAVTGTNGKTSTSNLIKEVLNNNKITTVNNSKGSNMASGIASSLIERATWSGKTKKDVAVFEVDERGSYQVYKYIKPTYLICTNLFRDSIKRNGHPEFIYNKINDTVPQSTTLILNADDLISSRLSLKNKRVYFSLDKINDEKQKNIVCDVLVCPLCKSKLEYDYIHYHHIGKAHCTNCNFKSELGNFIGTKVDINKGEVVIKENDNEIKYKLISESIYNIYNLIGVVALLRTYGLSHKQIQDGLEGIKLKTTRYDNIKTNNFEVITMLSKNQNPISTSLTIDYISKLKGNKVVVLLVTDTKDKKHGSEDISWLYDTDFEFLNKNDIKKIIVCGNRCYDLGLRLKIGNISEDKIITKEGYSNVEELVDTKDIDKVVILYELYGYDIATNIKKKLVGAK